MLIQYVEIVSNNLKHNQNTEILYIIGYTLASIYLPRLGRAISWYYMGTFEYYHCYGNPLYRVYIPKYDILQGCFMVCDWFSVWFLGSWNNQLSPVCRSSFRQITFKMSWYLNPREWMIYFLFINISTLIVTIDAYYHITIFIFSFREAFKLTWVICISIP